MSARKVERTEASLVFNSKNHKQNCKITAKNESVKDALYLSKMVSYAQGFSLLAAAAERYGWNLDLAAIAKIWRNGCIIRARFLTKITEAYQRNPKLQNLLFDDFFAETIASRANEWRNVLSSAILAGISMPCMADALSYFDSLRTENSGANMLQAQRDYFGAHTYERTDTPRGQFFHTDWANTGGKTHSGTYNA
jgi:6-phosphogluconate dehydrogenase